MKKFIALLVLVVPAMASAQALAPLTNVNDVTKRLVSIGNTFIYILVSLAVIFIVWNVVMWLVKGSDPEEKKKHLQGVLWGLLGLFIIVSIWGLVNILTNSFATTSTNQAIPNLGNSTGNGGIPANQVPVVQ